MGFINRIFSQYAARQKQDEFFGLLTFRPHKAIRADYFVGCVYFSPLAKDVDFLLYAPKNGPSPEQISFYKDEVEAYYHAGIQQSVPLMETALRKKQHEAHIQDFNREFEPYRMILPMLPAHTVPKWEMEYKTVHDPENHYTIVFSDHKPVEVTVKAAAE